jgi:hypothetical protein
LYSVVAQGFSALIVAAFTIALYCLGKRQIRIIAFQSKAMVKSIRIARDNASAAEESANAAKASAEGLKNTERAYVGIQYRQKGDEWAEDFSFHPCVRQSAIEDIGPECHRLHIRIVNTGRTPARIRGGGISCVIDLPKHPFNPLTAQFDDDSAISPNFLHAGGHYGEKLSYILSQAERDAKRHERLWLVGFVVYLDVFGRRHRAGFCRRPGLSKPNELVNKAWTKNNLTVDPTCDPYNYDYEIDEQGNRKQDA